MNCHSMSGRLRFVTWSDCLNQFNHKGDIFEKIIPKPHDFEIVLQHVQAPISMGQFVRHRHSCTDICCYSLSVERVLDVRSSTRKPKSSIPPVSRIGVRS